VVEESSEAVPFKKGGNGVLLNKFAIVFRKRR